jgi:hypothetical protein
MSLIHRNKMTKFFVYALLLLMAGCASSFSRQANKTLLDFLEDGKTTKEEVVFSRLGAPYSTFEGERIISYRLGKITEGYFVLGHIIEAKMQKDPTLYIGISGIFSLVLIFDENNVLQKHALVQIQ